MVLYGEDYAASAARELAEELGIVGVELVEHAHFLYDAPESRLWCTAYSAVSDAPLVLQPEEVLEARFISVEQALEEPVSCLTARTPWRPCSAIWRHSTEVPRRAQGVANPPVDDAIRYLASADFAGKLRRLSSRTPVRSQRCPCQSGASRSAVAGQSLS